MQTGNDATMQWYKHAIYSIFYLHLLRNEFLCVCYNFLYTSDVIQNFLTGSNANLLQFQIWWEHSYTTQYIIRHQESLSGWSWLSLGFTIQLEINFFQISSFQRCATWTAFTESARNNVVRVNRAGRGRRAITWSATNGVPLTASVTMALAFVRPDGTGNTARSVRPICWSAENETNCQNIDLLKIEHS